MLLIQNDFNMNHPFQRDALKTLGTPDIAIPAFRTLDPLDPESIVIDRLLVDGDERALAEAIGIDAAIEEVAQGKMGKHHDDPNRAAVQAQTTLAILQASNAAHRSRHGVGVTPRDACDVIRMAMADIPLDHQRLQTRAETQLYRLNRYVDEDPLPKMEYALEPGLPLDLVRQMLATIQAYPNKLSTLEIMDEVERKALAIDPLAMQQAFLVTMQRDDGQTGSLLLPGNDPADAFSLAMNLYPQHQVDGILTMPEYVGLMKPRPRLIDMNMDNHKDDGNASRPKLQ